MLRKMVARKRKPKADRIYFGPEVDASILRYNATEDHTLRSVIYAKEIRPAMEKLVENIIHTFKFYYTDNLPIKEVQADIEAYLIEKLPKYRKESGKAYSYFSRIVKNHCILLNKKNYKKLLSHVRVDLYEDYDLEEVESPPKDEMELHLSKAIDNYIAEWYDEIDVFFEKNYPQKPEYVQIGRAVLELFRCRRSLDIFNKKALYIFIREMTRARTSQITPVIRIMQGHFRESYSEFIKNHPI